MDSGFKILTRVAVIFITDRSHLMIEFASDYSGTSYDFASLFCFVLFLFCLALIILMYCLPIKLFDSKYLFFPTRIASL